MPITCLPSLSYPCIWKEWSIVCWSMLEESWALFCITEYYQPTKVMALLNRSVLYSKYSVSQALQVYIPLYQITFMSKLMLTKKITRLRKLCLCRGKEVNQMWPLLSKPPERHIFFWDCEQPIPARHICWDWEQHKYSFVSVQSS